MQCTHSLCVFQIVVCHNLYTWHRASLTNVKTVLVEQVGIWMGCYLLHDGAEHRLVQIPSATCCVLLRKVNRFLSLGFLISQFEGDNPYVSRVVERTEWGSQDFSQWSINFSWVFSNELHGFEANILRLMIQLLHLLIAWSWTTVTRHWSRVCEIGWCHLPRLYLVAYLTFNLEPML